MEKCLFMSDCLLTTERSIEGHRDFPVAKVRVREPGLWRGSAGFARVGDWLWSPTAFRLLL
jgi:hypothetical protein